MLIIGCDFHSRFQQIAMLDKQSGEMIERRLEHETGEARAFYAALPTPALVGMEATGYAQWFQRMLAEQGHELWVGDAAEYGRGWFGSRRRTNVTLLTCSVCCSRIGFRESGSLLPPSAIFGNCCGIDSNSSVCAAL